MGSEKLKNIEAGLFTLEFNEKQQCWHHNYGGHARETNGWFTVFRYCTDLEARVFEAFMERSGETTYSKEYVLKSAAEIKRFWARLLEHNINIVSTYQPKDARGKL